jgi:hypothetical protein
MIGVLALLTCFVCPVLEMVDSWDPPIQTGNDTEYTLVVVALCVGASYLFVRSILESPRVGFVDNSSLVSGVSRLFFFMSYCASPVAETSPPPLPLRI